MLSLGSSGRMIAAMLFMILFSAVGRAFTVDCEAVTDSVGEPMAYVTYRIFGEGAPDKAVVAATSDADGAFSATLPAAGQYSLVLSYVGMADKKIDFSVSAATPAAHLGKVEMQESGEMLADLTVTATRPLVSKEIDRVGYDVQADADSRTMTVREIMQKVPMLSVEADGTIKVNGSTNFKVYKNGRPNNGYTNNAKDIFASIPASMIKKIEVITEPGAKYDAEGVGAIINIVTAENTTVKGVMGNARLQSSIVNPVPGAQLYLSSQIDKVAFSVYGGYNHLGRKTMRGAESSEMNLSNGNTSMSRSETSSKGNISFFGADLSYDLDSLNLFTAEFNGYFYDIWSRGTGSQALLGPDRLPIWSYSSAIDNPKSSYLDIDANFNYQHSMRRPGENLTLSYMVSTTRQDNDSRTMYSDFVNSPVDYTGQLSEYNLNFIEHTFQADYVRPFGKIHTLDVGAKYIYRRNHSLNDIEYVGASRTHDDFMHTTNVGALYAQYSARVRAFAFRAGLRYEYSRLNASYEDDRPDYHSTLNDLVPSAAVSWQVDQSNSLSLNYAARINRPGISYLNPTVNETPSTVSSGNPDLSSARHNSMKLTYMLIKQKYNINFSANYDFSNNGIAAYNWLNSEDSRMYTSYRNIGRYRQVSFNAFVQWSITDKTRLMFNGGADYTRYSQSGMSLGRWSGRGFAQLTQTLPWKIQLELMGYYFGGNVNDVYSYFDSGRFSNSFMWGASLSRNFLKDDRLGVRISLREPVGRSTRRFSVRTVNGDYTGTAESRMFNLRTAELVITYRFGSLNTSVKKTARRIENDDLSGRKMDSGGASAGGQSQM